jgi:hypothetical protein
MKKQIIFFYFTFSLIYLFSQTTIPAGDVSGNWSLAGSPFLIEGEITIPNGENLSVDPGVLIEFQGHYSFNVQGQLLAVGTEQDSIEFTIADTTGFSNVYTMIGAWSGFIFDGTSADNDSSKIVYCKINYCKNISTYPNSIGAAFDINNFSKILISNCRIENNIVDDHGGTLHCFSASPIIKNNIFLSNT